MKIAGVYSFNHGREEVEKRYPHLLKEIVHVLNSIDSSRFKLLNMCLSASSETRTSKPAGGRSDHPGRPPPLSLARVNPERSRQDLQSRPPAYPPKRKGALKRSAQRPRQFLVPRIILPGVEHRRDFA